MRINGKVFLVVLGLATLALAATTLWLWPRLAGHGARPVVGRIALLLATQLSLAASFLFTVNAVGGFYTSWGQLFGTASARFSLADAGPPAGPAADAGQLLGFARTGQGRLVGLRSGLSVRLAVFTPAGYELGEGRGTGPRGGRPVGRAGSLGGGSGSSSGGGVGSGGVVPSGSASTGVVRPSSSTSQGTSSGSGSDSGSNSGSDSGSGAFQGLGSSAQASPRPGSPRALTAPAAADFPVEVVDLTGGADGQHLPDFQHLADAYRLIVVVVTDSATGDAIPGVNVPAGPQGELFWGQDLRTALAARYRVDASAADWGIAGAGASGAAAVNLAVQDSTRYGLAAAVGDWTDVPAQDGWPGIDRYLGDVPAPAVRLLYNADAPQIPDRIRSSDGPLLVAAQSDLDLGSALDWLGASIDANHGVAA